VPAHSWCCPWRRCCHERARHPGLDRARRGAACGGAPPPRAARSGEPDRARRPHRERRARAWRRRPARVHRAARQGTAGVVRSRRRRVRRSGGRAHRRAACGAAARHRDGDAFPRTAARRAAERRDLARRDLRTHDRAARSGRVVRAGGHRPAASTAIMLAVPASIAGCPVRVLCTPPRPDGTADPAVLVAARLCGIEQVFKLVAHRPWPPWPTARRACRRWTRSSGPAIPGSPPPKQIVAADADGAALDMPAGPSEVLVIADEAAPTGIRRGRSARPGRA